MPTNNMQDFMQIIKNGNPQELVLNILQKDAQRGNQVAGTLIQMINSGDSQGIERVARNIAKEKGIDFDKEFNSFKQMFRNF
jgi:hypothetical protein